jgi:hypothetical protein
LFELPGQDTNLKKSHLHVEDGISTPLLTPQTHNIIPARFNTFLEVLVGITVR